MKTIIGNILSIESGTILHQVNCRGVVGGLAGSLFAHHPEAFTDYFLLCQKYGAKNGGTCHEGHANAKLSILHVFAQFDPGAQTDMDLLRAAMRTIQNRDFIGPVYAPFKMGCGIGGGNWNQYAAVLDYYFPELVIVERPEDASKH